MGALVSSRYHFIENNPDAQISYTEMEHELQHLKKREQLSSFTGLGALVLSMLTLAGVLGGGGFILGALFAIAAFAAGYAYCCRMAEIGLREKQTTWFLGPQLEQTRVERLSPTAPEGNQGFLSYFLGK